MAPSLGRKLYTHASKPFVQLGEYSAINSHDDEENLSTSLPRWRNSWPRRHWTSLYIAWLLTAVFLLFNIYGALPKDETLVTTTEVIDWTQYAYVQYVTNHDYLCNSVMIFEALHRLESKADRLMMYPSTWQLDSNTTEATLLRNASAEYNVILQPVHIQHLDGGDATWADSFTKLLAFNQTQYKRVLSLDSDANVLQSMDELFLLPSSPVAMPRAYWLSPLTLSSQLMLIEPSTFEFKRILSAFQHRTDSQFDMEIVNNIYAKDCMIIPHRRYDLLTGEFRKKKNEHAAYLGSEEESWNATRALQEAKFLHFSDWPMRKPWLREDEEVRIKVQPECYGVESDGSSSEELNGEDEQEEEDCTERELWNSFYADFKERRTNICGITYDKPETVKPELETQPESEAGPVENEHEQDLPDYPHDDDEDEEEEEEEEDSSTYINV